MYQIIPTASKRKEDGRYREAAEMGMDVSSGSRPAPGEPLPGSVTGCKPRQ